MFVANYYIRIQGSVVSWQDRRISRLAAAMATRTGTNKPGDGRHRRATETAAEGHRTVPASVGPQYTGRPRQRIADHATRAIGAACRNVAWLI